MAPDINQTSSILKKISTRCCIKKGREIAALALRKAVSELIEQGLAAS
jgi:hypothetical protein